MADLSGLILTVLDLSFNVAKNLYHYSKNVKTASDGIQQLSNELFALIGVLEHLKLQRHSQNIETSTAIEALKETDSLPRVLKETVVFLRELQESLKVPESRLKSTLQQLKWPFKEDEINGHLQRLERVKTYLILSQMTNQMLV